METPPQRCGGVLLWGGLEVNIDNRPSVACQRSSDPEPLLPALSLW